MILVEHSLVEITLWSHNELMNCEWSSEDFLKSTEPVTWPWLHTLDNSLPKSVFINLDNMLENHFLLKSHHFFSDLWHRRKPTFVCIVFMWLWIIHKDYITIIIISVSRTRQKCTQSLLDLYFLGFVLSILQYTYCILCILSVYRGCQVHPVWFFSSVNEHLGALG